jgi:hypothetical protein
LADSGAVFDSEAVAPVEIARPSVIPLASLLVCGAHYAEEKLGSEVCRKDQGGNRHRCGASGISEIRQSDSSLFGRSTISQQSRTLKMNRQKQLFGLCLAVLVASLTSSPAFAQGLIFQLPEDGTGVEYRGEIIQENVRPDIAEGKETLKWDREISIKSVGREEAEFQGVVQPCRWIEIKVITGDPGAAGIDPGPVGARIYKVLVPESKVLDKPIDADLVPNVMLPIVRGHRRLGENQVKVIKSPALRIYPTVCLLNNYPEPVVVSPSESPQTVATNLSFNARHLKGQTVMERPQSRSTNEGHFWVTPEVPFGLARWEVVVTREQKESTASRDTFAEVSTIKSTMSVQRILDAAESELNTQ